MRKRRGAVVQREPLRQPCRSSDPVSGRSERRGRPPSSQGRARRAQRWRELAMSPEFCRAPAEHGRRAGSRRREELIVARLNESSDLVRAERRELIRLKPSAHQSAVYGIRRIPEAAADQVLNVSARAARRSRAAAGARGGAVEGAENQHVGTHGPPSRRAVKGRRTRRRGLSQTPQSTVQRRISSIASRWRRTRAVASSSPTAARCPLQRGRRRAKLRTRTRGWQ